MGLWKGKKGSSVFYKIWNSNNKEVQGIREYQPNVSNPQTDYQADQRMKLLPAQLIKGALRDIISRSFQGTPYGSKSRLEFMKYALKTEVFPFLPKDSTDPIPGEYLISRGSLSSVTCNYDSGNLNFVTNLINGGQTRISDSSTIQQTSEALLDGNQWLQEGDQITVVGCLINYPTETTTYIRWIYWSFVLDRTDTSKTLGDIPGYDDISLDGYDVETYFALNNPNDAICSAGIIVSRLGDDGQYLRSNCRLAIALPRLEFFYDPAMQQQTRASYQTGSNSRRNYDWPVEEGGQTSSVSDGTYTLSGLSGDLATLNGQKVKVRVSDLTGEVRAVYVSNTSTETQKYLVDPNGGMLQYTATGGEVTYLQQSQVPALSNYTTVVYQEGQMLSVGQSAEGNPTQTRKTAKKSAKKLE